MKTNGFAAAIAFLLLIGCSDSSAGRNSAVTPTPSGGSQPNAMPYTIETALENLNVPWDMDMAPDGRIFFTERPGALRVVADGKLIPDPVISFPAPFVSRGEGGLLGLALDPQFAQNGYIYVYHSYEENRETRNRVLRLVTDKNTAKIDKVLIDGLPGAANHNGGRIKFGPDGYLYITAGDRYEPKLAQDVQSLGGKILRIARDGSIPADNPHPGSPVYSMGHRNPQGLAWHPDTRKLYESEHGQSAHDEINLIEPGANYGWPLIEGDERNAQRKELRLPLIHSGDNTWAPSGMAFVKSGPWRGQLLVANLRGQQILKLSVSKNDPALIDTVVPILKQYGRIRSVFAAPDGSIYFMTNNRDGRGVPKANDDKLIRLKPKH